MRSKVNFLIITGLAAGLLTSGLSLHGQDAEEPAVPAAAEAVATEAGAEDAAIEDKLLKMTTLEDAFLKAARTRNLLQRYIIQERGKIEDASEETKAELKKNIASARKRLQTLSIAMDVVFGIGQRRTYEYNPVTSTVYLKVGTVEDAFARAVRTRDALQKFVREQSQALDEADEQAAKDEIQKKIDVATQQYRTVAAALQLVFGVTPQRNYLYNPKNSTLYLRISDQEVEKLKAQLNELQQERADEEAGESDLRIAE